MAAPEFIRERPIFVLAIGLRDAAAPGSGHRLFSLLLSDAASDEISLSASWPEASILWTRSANIALQGGRGALQGADRARVQVVLQKEDLVVKGLQDWRDLVFGAAHGAHVSGLARFCVAQHDGILRLQFSVIHRVDFALPFLKQIVAHLVDRLDLVVELARLRVGAFVIGVEALVRFFQRAALESRSRPGTTPSWFAVAASV